LGGHDSMINQTCREYCYNVLEIPNDQPILDEIKWILGVIKLGR